jgi:hypothetical protein
VKLWQFDPSDSKQVRLDSRALPLQPCGERPGVSSALLFRDERQEVRLERWLPDARVMLSFPVGGEILVIEGSFAEAGQKFEEQSWLRLPPNDCLVAVAGPVGCKIWMKMGEHRPARVEAVRKVRDFAPG